MDVGERDELMSLTNKLEHWSKIYDEQRQRSAIGKYNLDLIIGSRIDQIREFKSNFSTDTAIYFLLGWFRKEAFEFKGDEILERISIEKLEEIKKYRLDSTEGEARYKGAEKMCAAITEKMNAIKFVNKEIR